MYGAYPSEFNKWGADSANCLNNEQLKGLWNSLCWVNYGLKIKKKGKPEFNWMDFWLPWLKFFTG